MKKKYNAVIDFAVSLSMFNSGNDEDYIMREVEKITDKIEKIIPTDIEADISEPSLEIFEEDEW